MHFYKILFLKTTLGLAATGGAAGAGIIYREKIVDFFLDEKKENGDPDSTTNDPIIEESKVIEINEKITSNLGFPKNCELDKTGKNNIKECGLTEEQLKKINFRNKDNGDLTIEGNVDGLKLEIRTLSKKNGEEDTRKYGKNFNENDLRFIFKEFKNDIKIKKNSGDNKPIVLKKGTDPEFEVYFGDNKLGFFWYLSLLAKKVGLNCEKEESSTNCKPLENKNKETIINLIEDGKIKEIKIENGDKEKKIIATKEQENYNQGYKFNVSEKIAGKDGSGELKIGDYEIKYLEGMGWGLSIVSSS